MERKLQKFSKLMVIIGTMICCATAAIATSVPNNSSNPKTFLGPTAHFGVARGLSDNTAVYGFGEAGLRNLRLGGTWGWEMTYYQRLKASAELLRQKITYSFFDGRQSPWLNQGALGLDYQYDFHETAPYETKLDLAGYYSHAPSKNLGTGTGYYINNLGNLTYYSVDRRIAGSNVVGLSPGVTFSPWWGSSINARVNYDYVNYDTNSGSSRDAIGFGGTVRVDQLITQDVNVGVAASVRQPYNNYQADLSWGNVPYYGIWIFKIFGAYTIGKNSLPTTYNVGIGADYLIGADNPMPVMVSESTANYKDKVVTTTAPERDDKVATTTSTSKHDYKGEFVAKPQYKDHGFKDIVPPVEWEEYDNVNSDLLRWTSVPAVYMPQVIAITNESVCIAPRVVANIPDQGLTVFQLPYTFSVAPYFSGTNLTYSLKFNNTQAQSYTSISGSTVTVDQGSDVLGLSIVASNACGTAESNQFIAYT